MKHWTPQIDWKTYAGQTGYKDLIEWENPALTRLKTHFSLLCHEKEDFDKVEVKYYKKSPSLKAYIYFAIFCLLWFGFWLNIGDLI